MSRQFTSSSLVKDLQSSNSKADSYNKQIPLFLLTPKTCVIKIFLFLADKKSNYKLFRRLAHLQVQMIDDMDDASTSITGSD